VKQLLVTSAPPRGRSRRHRCTACAARRRIETSREDRPHLEDPVLDPERADAVGSDQNPVRTARQHPPAQARPRDLASRHIEDLPHAVGAAADHHGRFQRREILAEELELRLVLHGSLPLPHQPRRAAGERLAHLGRRHGDGDARLLERGDLVAGAPLRLPAGAFWPAMKATTGLLILVRMSSAAVSSAEPPISPTMTTALVRGSASKSASASKKVVPITGSPPMPRRES